MSKKGISRDYILSCLAGMSFPGVGGAYDYMKDILEAEAEDEDDDDPDEE